MAKLHSIATRVALAAVIAVTVAVSAAWAEDDGPARWQGAASKAAEAAEVRAQTPSGSQSETPSAQKAESPAPVVPGVEPSLEPTAARIDQGPAAAKPPTTESKPPATDAKLPPAAASPSGAKEAPAAKVPPTPAKQLFGTAKSPSPLAARAIGSYAKGCLAGGAALPIDGPAWQAMRLSRNRNWGHPELISLLERFAGDVKDKDGWPGLLVGDISQPRGGPMLTGHASHQLGLDADVWFTPMPSRRLTKQERENLSATSMLAADNLSVNPKVWGEGQSKIVKRVASYPNVERVLVHPAIKKALCAWAGTDRKWLSKVRPIWGHYYHFHIRIGCPKGSAGCVAQAPVPGDDGCGKELEDWYKLLTAPPPPKPKTPPAPVVPKPPLTLADLPADCRNVLESGEESVLAGPAGGSVSSSKPEKKQASQD